MRAFCREYEKTAVQKHITNTTTTQSTANAGFTSSSESTSVSASFHESTLTFLSSASIFGSIFGIGFPAWTGGVAQYIDQYEGGTTGFVARCKELADRYGDRFSPPASLVEKADRGEPFRPEETRGLR